MSWLSIAAVAIPGLALGGLLALRSLLERAGREMSGVLFEP